MNESIRNHLTAVLAQAIENQLRLMGDDIKGLSWFSSSAKSHPKNQ